jgi:hypothetical protein
LIELIHKILGYLKVEMAKRDATWFLCRPINGAEKRAFDPLALYDAGIYGTGAGRKRQGFMASLLFREFL